MGAILHLDFETRSSRDLIKVGLHQYAHPSFTHVLCAAWAFDDEEIQINTNGTIDRRVVSHVHQGGEVWAHNASFEFEIWNKIFYPEVPMKIEQMTCTMAMAYAMGLPGSLDGCAAALGLDTRKDLEGSRIMKQISKPKEVLPDGQVIWWDDPEKFERLYSYCKQDVVVEREVGKRMMKLSPYEKKVWMLDQKINARGITIDRKAVTQAVKLVETEKDRMNLDIQKLSNGNIATCTATQQIKDYLEFFGIAADSIDKPSVAALLENPTTHPHAKEVLTLRSLGNKAATSKLEAMLSGAAEDNKLRGSFQYSGANTRRWSGRRVQLHNLKRPPPDLKPKIMDKIINDIANGMPADLVSLNYGEPMTLIGDCTRGFITASPGCDLIVCDFSAIEARKLAWLAGQDNVLEIFKSGKDIYLVQASDIFRKTIDDKEDPRRQVGKVAILALGYQGGVGAFQQMAKAYNVKMAPAFPELWDVSDFETREKALDRYKAAGEKYEISKEEFLASEITKIMWRRANPRIVEYWSHAENALIQAIQNPNVAFTIGQANRAVSFKKVGSFLWVKLPSGGVICYPYPELRETKTPWGTKKLLPTYMAEDGQSKKWMRFSTYGGSIVENIDQSSSRDLLAESMLNLDAKNYSIAAHVHDEIICDMPKGEGSLEEMQNIMSKPPLWAFDLPLASAGWRGHRYRK